MPYFLRLAHFRSIKQLKREIKAAMEAKAGKAEVKGLGSDDEMDEAPYCKVRHRTAR